MSYYVPLPAPRPNRLKSPPNRVLPDNPTQAVKAMIDIIIDLEAMFAEENKILKEARLSDFKDFKHRKETACRHYGEAMSDLLSRREDLKGVDPTLKDQLRVLYDGFSQTRQQNLKNLDRMETRNGAHGRFDSQVSARRYRKA